MCHPDTYRFTEPCHHSAVSPALLISCDHDIFNCLQVDVLSAAFRNLPADDYEAALEHLQNLLDSLSNSSKLGLYQAGSSAHQTMQYMLPFQQT